MTRIKLSFAILFAIIIGVGFASCEKENELLNTQDGENNMQKNVEEQYSDIIVKNGMLNFKDKETFLMIYNTLEQNHEEWNKTFFEENASLNDTELEKKIDEENFNEYKVLADFEQKYNFNSLRKKIAKETEVWLNNEELDLQIDPDNHFIDDEIFRTLLNVNSELKIGKSIFKMTESGIMYEIIDADLNTLSKVKQNINKPDLLSSVKNINIHYWKSDDCSCKSSTCKQNKSKVQYNNYETDRLVKYKITITNGPNGHYVKATTTSYKRKRKKWKRYNTSIQAKIYEFDVYFNFEDCEAPDTFASVTKSYNSSSYIKAKRSFGWNSVYAAKKNEITSYHYCNGWSSDLTLTW